MKIALLHRHEEQDIKQTNASFPFLKTKGIDVYAFKKFNRIGRCRVIKSLCWIFYAPFLARGYDVIYCDDSFPVYAGLVKLFNPKSKVFLRLGDIQLMYHLSGWAYKIAFIFERWSWNKVDRIIAISDVMGDYVKQFTIKPVDVVLDPVNPADFRVDRPFRSALRTVMFHGTLTKNKGLDIILKCADIMKSIRFIIIGGGEELERLRKKAGKNVLFTGWLDFKEVKKYLHTCHVGLAIRGDNPGNEFVVTSPYLQYGVCGRPCVVSRRKVFGNYPYQFSNVDEMCLKISEALKDKNSGKELQSYILKNHNASKIADEIYTILTEKINVDND